MSAPLAKVFQIHQADKNLKEMHHAQRKLDSQFKGSIGLLSEEEKDDASATEVVAIGPKSEESPNRAGVASSQVESPRNKSKRSVISVITSIKDEAIGTNLNKNLGLSTEEFETLIELSAQSKPNIYEEEYLKSINALTWGFGNNKNDELSIKAQGKQARERNEQLPCLMVFEDE